jgi:dGTPase
MTLGDTSDDSRHQLASYAVTANHSLGRRYDEPPPAFRSQFQRDRDRIIHCSAFRRLEYKTQVFVNHEGDMFRTRLTHSLEVSQIARTVARALNLNEDLTEAISLAHDLGHTPFGHAGQKALNECMNNFGGFEHNLQSLRVVDRLEDRYPEFPGLNLLFETREGILKHCSPQRARALGQIGKRFRDGTQPSLEAQLANIADEIAYNHHDIDDGLRANLLKLEQLLEFSLFRELYELELQRQRDADPKRMVQSVIREMLNHFAIDLIRSTTAKLHNIAPRNLDDIRMHTGPIVDFQASVREQHLALKRLLRHELYFHHQVVKNADRAGLVVTELFGAFFSDPSLLPPERVVPEMQDEQLKARHVADYVAGMTDRFAFAEYHRIYGRDPIRVTSVER